MTTLAGEFWQLSRQPASTQQARIPPSAASATFGMLSTTNPARSKASVSDEVDTLVICPELFEPALQRWLKYRRQQDHVIEVQRPGQSAFEIRQQVLDAGRRHPLRHVVLIGDAFDPDTDRKDRIPTDYVMARVNIKFGSEPEIATDNTYADLDGNGIPDVSIGRIPVDTPKELESFIDRIIRYEQGPAACECLRRINFVAGVGGFGKIVDGAIEATTKQIITDLLPGCIETSMTYGSWSSPYCPDPRCFSDSAIDRFNEGCLFWVYIGHGSTDRLDQVRMPDRAHDILDRNLVDKIDCRVGNPIAIFLACYTNAIDARQDCLAELMLKRDNGPIATIGGTRVTMPGAMGLLSLELMHEYFNGSAQTLGELFLLAKQRMIGGSNHYRQYREMIEGMAKTFNPGSSFKREKYEHAQLLHLLGDPLLRVARPLEVTFGGPVKATAGQKVVLSGKSPAKGQLTFELAYRRDRLKERFARRRTFDPSDETLTMYQATYDTARDLVCCRQSMEVNAGLFSTEFEIPASANGPCVIRAILKGEDGLGLGSMDVEISRANDGESGNNP